MKGHLDLSAPEESIQNRLVTHSMKADEAPEIVRKENLPDPGHPGIRSNLFTDPAHQGEISLEPLLFLREKAQQCLRISSESALLQADLKTRVDVFDLPDGDKLDL